MRGAEELNTALQEAKIEIIKKLLQYQEGDRSPSTRKKQKITATQTFLATLTTIQTTLEAQFEHLYTAEQLQNTSDPIEQAACRRMQLETAVDPDPITTAQTNLNQATQTFNDATTLKPFGKGLVKKSFKTVFDTVNTHSNAVSRALKTAKQAFTQAKERNISTQQDETVSTPPLAQIINLQSDLDNTQGNETIIKYLKKLLEYASTLIDYAEQSGFFCWFLQSYRETGAQKANLILELCQQLVDQSENLSASAVSAHLEKAGTMHQLEQASQRRKHSPRFWTFCKSDQGGRTAHLLDTLKKTATQEAGHQITETNGL